MHSPNPNVLVVLYWNRERCYTGGNWMKGRWDLSVLFLKPHINFYSYLRTPTWHSQLSIQLSFLALVMISRL